jgi:hypothetical protein
MPRLLDDANRFEHLQEVTGSSGLKGLEVWRVVFVVVVVLVFVLVFQDRVSLYSPGYPGTL